MHFLFGLESWVSVMDGLTVLAVEKYWIVAFAHR